MNSDTMMESATGGIPRIKKALTLAERIDVIQEYERTPNTRHLARMFGCGRTQIQNILRHRREYLEEWQNNGDPYRVRRRQSVRLLTLGAIIYEWIQRSRCYNVTITDDLIRQTGQRVAQMLDIPEFRPSNRWLERLKIKYRLNDLDLLGIDPKINGSDLTHKSLKLEDIIKDLGDPYAQDNFLVLPHIKTSEMIKQAMLKRQLSNHPETQFSNRVEEHRNEMESDFVYVLSDSGQSDTSDNDIPTFLNLESAGNPDAYEGISKRVALTGITSYKEALNHLGPLEQFALLEEDIRAIGLINQLENIFRDKMQLKDK